jgi:hypothetical protein
MLKSSLFSENGLAVEPVFFLTGAMEEMDRRKMVAEKQTWGISPSWGMF